VSGEEEKQVAKSNNLNIARKSVTTLKAQQGKTKNSVKRMLL